MAISNSASFSWPLETRAFISVEFGGKEGTGGWWVKLMVVEENLCLA